MNNYYIFDQFKEQVRDANPLIDVAQEYLGEFRGSKPVYLCPLHKEETPSFSLHPSGGFFKCFGCGAVVDVFALVMHFKKLDFKGALEFLAQRANISFPQFSNEDSSASAKRWEQGKRGEELLEVVLETVKNKSQSGGSYLSGRSIKSDLAETYEVISCDLTVEEMKPVLAGRGYTTEEIEQSGTLKDSRFFENSLIIPIRMRGKLATLCSRTLGDRDPKYLYLTSHSKGIFNYDEAVPQKEIIICEAPVDALTLISNGFTNAISLGGCQASKEQREILKRLRDKKFVISFDNDADSKDNPGKTAAIDLAKELNAKIIILPSPDSKKVDINDFFVAGHSVEEFAVLKDEAKDVVEVIISAYPHDLPKVNIKETLKTVFEYLLTRDQIDATNCLRYIIASYFKLTGREIEDYLKHLNKLRKKQEKEQRKTPEISTEPEEPLEQFTDEEKAAALTILNASDLFYQILSFIKKTGVVGEEKNILIHYCALTSRITEDILSEIVKGESAVGKSFTLQKVLDTFPKSAYRDITDATAQSFYHVAKDHFAHRIIVIFEKHGQEKSDYSIRSLQSEKKLRLQITTKDPKTGQFVVKVKEVDGPAGFITTTTDARIHSENETRNISIYPDESVEQTYRTFEATDAKYLGLDFVDKDELKIWRALQTILKPYPVFIPFVIEIRKKFPKWPTRVRRDYGKFLTFLSVITLLHQAQREKIIVNSKEHLKATLVDYHLAKIIMEDTLSKTIYEIPPKSEQLILKAKDLVASATDLGITIGEIARALEWDEDTGQKWAKPAIQKGFLVVAEEHRGSRAAKYKVSDRKFEYQSILPSTEELIEINRDWLGTNSPYDPITGEELIVDSTDVPMPKEQGKNTHEHDELQHDN